MPIKKPPEGQMLRCAIYTRKSTSLGLEMKVNSLETQREVCRAYIRCQEHRNWIEIPEQYDDGGFSGGTLERPALKRLIADIELGRIDIVVIYKIDRLSRSLTDFVRLVDVLDKYQTSFVSVTQTFDTSDSMGRLVLNILLTFAQFERELMSERIKDRYAERRRKGLYCGGTPPVGYLVKRGGRLVPDPERADMVRSLFHLYPESSAIQLATRLREQNFTTKRYVSLHGSVRGGQRFNSAHVINILKNPLYAGYCYYRGELQKADLDPLISRDEWDAVQVLLSERSQNPKDPVVNCLKDILHDELGRRMKVFETGFGRSRRNRHYASEKAVWARGTKIKRVMVDAARVEALAVSALKGLLTNRIKLKETVLSLGVYSSDTAKLLKRGHLAARRIDLMNPTQLREMLVALVPRAEVTKSELRLLISTFELSRFLAWDGVSLFQKETVRPRNADRFRMIYAPAFLICGHSYFAFPLLPARREGDRNEDLVRLLNNAREFRDMVIENRALSLAELARKRNLGAAYFARILRLSYLAPDIQAAIVDGTQPASLTRKKLVFSALPLDWEQQRHLLGFDPLP